MSSNSHAKMRGIVAKGDLLIIRLYPELRAIAFILATLWAIAVAVLVVCAVLFNPMILVMWIYAGPAGLLCLVVFVFSQERIVVDRSKGIITRHWQRFLNQTPQPLDDYDHVCIAPWKMPTLLDGKVTRGYLVQLEGAGESFKLRLFGLMEYNAARAFAERLAVVLKFDLYDRAG